MGTPWFVPVLGTVAVIALLVGGLAVSILIGRWLKKGGKASQAETFASQLKELQEMKAKGLLTQVEYDAIRRQLLGKMKESGDTFPGK